MGSFRVDFTNTSNETGTVIPDAGLSYTDRLNSVNEASIRISGTGELKRGLVEMGSTVKIYRNDALEFYGLADKIDFLEGGALSVHATGYEIKLTQENGDYANSPYTSTASATIANEIIAESTDFSAGTVEAGANIDFRIAVTDSLWNGLSNLIGKVSQDIQIDYANAEVDILDHRGSATSVQTMNAGIDLNNLRVTHSYPLGNDVRVYGKGDGENQIKSAHATHGQDATSKSTYGVIRKIYRDSTVVSQSEADTLADALVAKYKDPTKIYDFEVVNPNQTLTTGDVITLNAKDQGLSSESVRVINKKRGLEGNSEFLILRVTNAAYGILTRDINDLLGKIQKSARDDQTYMQGTTNILTFSEKINANNSAGLNIYAQLPSSFILDEVGNNRVNSFTVDYDVDEFRSTIGTATETSVAPSLSAGSTDSHKHDASDSGHDHNNSTQTSSASWIGSDEGSDTSTSVSCSSGSWTTVCSEYVGNVNNTSVFFVIDGNSGGAEDISVRIYNNATTPGTVFQIYQDGFRDVCSLEMRDVGGGPCDGDYIKLEVFPHSGAITVDGYIGIHEKAHTHSISSWDVSDENAAVSDANKTPGLSGNAASHDHSVSVGDAVSDAGSVNASQVSLYLDFWNTGTSAWVNKHSILNTGKTLDTDVDISDSGTYPDAAGFWRVRILTDNATPDLIQGIIKVKHQLDT